VRAIAGFKCPVLTGIGHDVDVTLSELVADVGASTPTAVAETLNETWDTLTSSFDSAQEKIFSIYSRSLSNISLSIYSSEQIVIRKFSHAINELNKILSGYSTKVRSFFIQLERRILIASSAFQSVVGIIKSTIRNQKNYLRDVPNKLSEYMKDFISTTTNDLQNNTRFILTTQKTRTQRVQESLVSIEKSVRLSDPSHNLKLGYSLSYLNGKLARSVKDVNTGDITETHLSDGSFTSEVKNVK
jgi:exodeoxyribonuclease VII large subunit